MRWVLVLILVLVTALAIAADIFKMNPHTGKLDNTGPVSQAQLNAILANLSSSSGGGLPVSTFTTYTSTAFKASRFVNFSTHWGRSDSSKLDVATHNSAVQGIYSSIAGKVDSTAFNQYAALTDSNLLTKTPYDVFNSYTSSKKGVTKGDTGPTGYDGKNSLVATCSIIPATESIASVVYDSNGNTDVTTLGPFIAYLYEGSDALLPKEYTWYQPYLKTQLREPVAEPGGYQIKHQYYQPRVLARYSSVRSTNYIKVSMRYSSATGGYNGVCETAYTIPITQVGTQGIQGPTGATGAATREGVQRLFSSAQYKSNVPVQFRPFDNLTSSWLFAMRDYAGNVRMKLNGHGYQAFMDANGYTMTSINQGTIALLTNNVKRLEMKKDGSFVVYRNGVPVFQIFSTGRWVGSEGYGPTASKKYPYALPSGYRGYTSITINPVAGAASVVRYAPYSTYHTVGRKFGNYSSMLSQNSRYYGSTEINATPGFTFEVLFKGIEDFNQVELLERYVGEPTHYVDIQIYNWLSSSWQTLETIAGQSVLTQKIYSIMGSQPFLSGTNVRLRFNHTTTGTVTHQMLVDYVSLTKNTGAGMPQGALKSFQYNRAGSFAGAAQMQYSSVSATRGRVILPSGVSNIEYVNSRRSLIFSICSSVRLVIGGGC